MPAWTLPKGAVVDEKYPGYTTLKDGARTFTCNALINTDEPSDIAAMKRDTIDSAVFMMHEAAKNYHHGGSVQEFNQLMAQYRGLHVGISKYGKEYREYVDNYLKDNDTLL